MKIPYIKTDLVAVIKKVGKLLSYKQQFCFAYAIHPAKQSEPKTVIYTRALEITLTQTMKKTAV